MKSLWFGVFYLPLLFNAIVLSINFCFDYETWFIKLRKGKHDALLLLLCLLCYFFLLPDASVFLFLSQFLFYLKFLQSILNNRLLLKKSLVFLCSDWFSLFDSTLSSCSFWWVWSFSGPYKWTLIQAAFYWWFPFLFVLRRNESTYVSFDC